MSCFQANPLPIYASLAALRIWKLYAPQLRGRVPLTLMSWSPRRMLHTLVRGLDMTHEVLVLTHCVQQRILLIGIFMPYSSIVLNRKF